MQANIIFRQVQEPLPPGWKPGVHWQVEAYDGHSPCPLGIAWVSDFGAAAPITLDYILIRDENRRQGVATLLVRECLSSFYDLHFADPLTAAGVSLMRSLRKRGIVIDR